jgi:hypothetical protein
MQRMLRSNADTCPHCGDVIKEPRPKLSLVDLIPKISVPVVLSVVGTMITILTYFSMEGERQMEEARKLLADAFDKDPDQTMGGVFCKADRQHKDKLVNRAKILDSSTRALLGIAKAMLSARGNGTDPLGFGRRSNASG